MLSFFNILIFIVLFNSYLLLAIKEYAAWSRAMIRLHILRWSKNNFDRGLVRCNALIIFIGQSPRYSPHAYSTIFVMIRGGYPERKQPWGRHWTPWETHVSLFPYWWIARFWIRRYRWMYILINLIIPTADVLKALNGRVSSKWRRMMKREDIFVSLTFQVSQSHFPFLGSAI